MAFVSGQSATWLGIINKLDNVVYNVEESETLNRVFESFWAFLLHDEPESFAIPVGYIADWLVEAIQWSHHPLFSVHRETKVICLNAKHDAAKPRDADSQGSKSLSTLVMDLPEHGGVPGFRHLHRKGDRHQILGLQSRIDIDRNAAQLFGIVNTGAHMTCYTRGESEDGQMRIWVPRRAFDKTFDPGKLDNTVAGGITNGDTPLQTILTEAEEEAALSRDFVSENIKATGTLSYFNQCSTVEGGHMRPRVLHTFELELPEDMIPSPHDGEVCEFLRMSAQEMQEAVMAGEMTEDAAMVCLAFLSGMALWMSRTSLTYCKSPAGCTATDHSQLARHEVWKRIFLEYPSRALVHHREREDHPIASPT